MHSAAFALMSICLLVCRSLCVAPSDICMQCYQDYLKQGLAAITSHCLANTVAAALNLVLIPLVLIIKIPQIAVIARNRSVEGLSYFGFNMEFLMTNMTLAYGLHAEFSFWIYGENVIMSIQNLAIIALFFYFTQSTEQQPKHTPQLKLIPLFLANILISSLFLVQAVPESWQELSIWLQLGVFMLARGSQIVSNFVHKTTKNLSLKTVVITLFCNYARTITIYVQSPESIGYLLNFLVAILVNSVLLAQILYYRRNAQLKFQ